MGRDAENGSSAAAGRQRQGDQTWNSGISPASAKAGPSIGQRPTASDAGTGNPHHALHSLQKDLKDQLQGGLGSEELGPLTLENVPYRTASNSNVSSRRNEGYPSPRVEFF